MATTYYWAIPLGNVADSTQDPHSTAIRLLRNAQLLSSDRFSTSVEVCEISLNEQKAFCTVTPELQFDIVELQYWASALAVQRRQIINLTNLLQRLLKQSAEYKMLGSSTLNNSAADQLSLTLYGHPRNETRDGGTATSFVYKDKINMISAKSIKPAGVALTRQSHGDSLTRLPRYIPPSLKTCITTTTTNTPDIDSRSATPKRSISYHRSMTSVTAANGEANLNRVTSNRMWMEEEPSLAVPPSTFEKKVPLVSRSSRPFCDTQQQQSISTTNSNSLHNEENNSDNTFSTISRENGNTDSSFLSSIMSKNINCRTNAQPPSPPISIMGSNISFRSTISSAFSSKKRDHKKSSATSSLIAKTIPMGFSRVPDPKFINNRIVKKLGVNPPRETIQSIPLNSSERSVSEYGSMYTQNNFFPSRVLTPDKRASQPQASNYSSHCSTNNNTSVISSIIRPIQKRRSWATSSDDIGQPTVVPPAVSSVVFPLRSQLSAQLTRDWSAERLTSDTGQPHIRSVVYGLNRGREQYSDSESKSSSSHVRVRTSSRSSQPWFVHKNVSNVC